MKNCPVSRRPGRCLRGLIRYFTRRYPHPDPVHIAPALPGNRVQLLVNGNEAFPEMLAMIHSAEHSIRWQVMLFHPDEVGRQLVDALAAAAQRGVRVQLSFGIGQSVNGSVADRVPRDTKQRHNQQMRLLLGLLRGAGVDVRENPAGMNFSLAAAGPRARAIQCSIGSAVCISANHYDHRKLLVVDGRKALIGGMNVGRNYLYETAPDPALTMADEVRQRQAQGLPEAWDKWFDVAMTLEGPVVAEIIAAFNWKWEVLGGAALPPEAPSPTAGTTAVQFLEQRPDYAQISTRLFELIGAAKREIWVASPFISYTLAVDALRAAARRGVRVVLVVPNAFQEMPVSGNIFNEFVPDLLAAGVEVRFNDQRMAHTKLLVVDGQFTLLGSFNLNFRSFHHDLEVAGVINDTDFASSVIQRVFHPYLAISNRVHSFARPPFSLFNWVIRPIT